MHFGRYPLNPAIGRYLGVTPCQHSNSLAILHYLQVKQQAVKKEDKKQVPVYQPNNTSRQRRLNKPQHCVNKQ